MLYTASPFVVPEIGPLRWTFYVLLIWTGVLLVSILFVLFIPETYHPVYTFEAQGAETALGNWR
ncbi:MFS transporter [Penicillium cf. griseofulvum]|uniref:MFS transporter n=1 Tax=Penicillium cf. griseofulvum TaxID=2972120 RepID=A0A9W9T1H2_9EURO|nr:MFS transporter [Penicillium cf. griseofulvum]KAJ5441208.1 MFS transporter [Penicillium cf. griseofulvum]KAJ5449256.1 MFS transporter [Penicillium cf. griseofulvum]